MRNFNWVISDTTGATANNTGSFIEIDQLAFLPAGATATPTSSPTMTITPGGPTHTFTATPTATPPAGPTYTPTHVNPDELIVSDLIIYPNPADPDITVIKINYTSNGNHSGQKLKFFTAGLRLIKQFDLNGIYYPGNTTITLPAGILSDLSAGIYYYYVGIADDRGKETKSKIMKLIILR
jgi:hypothetical protein